MQRVHQSASSSIPQLLSCHSPEGVANHHQSNIGKFGIEVMQFFSNKILIPTEWPYETRKTKGILNKIEFILNGKPDMLNSATIMHADMGKGKMRVGKCTND